MDARRPVDGRATGLMVLLCATWGMQQVAIKAATPFFPPPLQISLRSGIAAALVALIMWRRKERLDLRKTGLAGLGVGILFFLEFYLIGEALRYTSASRSVVFLYTAPIFAALGLHRKLPSERLSRVQWLGILVAFFGIVIAFDEPTARDSIGQTWRGDFLALFAGTAWGATTVVIRSSSLSEAPATETLLYQLLGAFVFLLAAALSLGETQFHLTPAVIGNLVFQTLIVSFASFLAWFDLLKRYLASTLGVLSFMTPVFGVLFGVVLLGETLESRFLVGACFVLGGIFRVTKKPTGGTTVH